MVCRKMFASGAAWRFSKTATVYVHPRGAAHLIDPTKLVESAMRIFGDDMQRLWGQIAPVPAEHVKILEDNPSTSTGIGLGQIYYGPSLSLNYNDPTKDPRTPDIIVTPNVGVTYSGSKAKLAEHGGFGHDDTNVVLLLSNPSFVPKTVSVGVGTAQVAPTILKALDLNPASLYAVRVEGTSVLPDVKFSW